MSKTYIYIGNNEAREKGDGRKKEICILGIYPCTIAGNKVCKCEEYHKYIASLPRIKIHSDLAKTLKEGQEIVEGKDFKIIRGKQIDSTDEQQWREMSSAERDEYFEKVAVELSHGQTDSIPTKQEDKPEERFIVAEISKNWVKGNPIEASLLSSRFEMVINTNLARGYLLKDWKINSFIINDTVNEIIIAIFEKIE